MRIELLRTARKDTVCNWRSENRADNVNWLSQFHCVYRGSGIGAANFLVVPPRGPAFLQGSHLGVPLFLGVPPRGPAFLQGSHLGVSIQGSWGPGSRIFNMPFIGWYSERSTLSIQSKSRARTSCSKVLWIWFSIQTWKSSITVLQDFFARSKKNLFVLHDKFIDSI